MVPHFDLPYHPKSQRLSRLAKRKRQNNGVKGSKPYIAFGEPATSEYANSQLSFWCCLSSVFLPLKYTKCRVMRDSFSERSHINDQLSKLIDIIICCAP